ncbi:ATP synthase subunit a [Golovinomyces cichoracearum]|uniref:ATP synthase subunit a n=1 Tax=Golovinomyces cichoracearum TaxID=62708 RepID=A0A420I988_9PEZI|nr:ATP synthase subunit a [Golovinomyces cichoracearum]
MNFFSNIISPLDQFEIRNLISLYLTIAGYLVFSISLVSNNNNKVTSNPNKRQKRSSLLSIYVCIIFIYTSMVPYSFASTSHFVLTFSLSFTIVLGATILGFSKHGLQFFSLFVPAGCPLGLLPLLVLIEFISYLARNVSLGLRLAANILSGHMLLNILSGFTYNIMSSGFIFFFLGLFPLAFIIAFSGLELGIAFIQAQVFVVLSCSYIKDALDLH